MPRYSFIIIDSSSFVHGDIPGILQGIRRHGYEGVEFNLTSELLDCIDQVKQGLRDSGLAAPSFLTGAAYQEGLCLSAPDAGVRRRTVERLKSYLPVARRFDAVLVVGLLQGLRSDEADTETANRRIEEGLREVGTAAEAQGVELVIEPVNHLQVGFNNSVAEVRRLISAIGSPAIRPMVDTIHMNIEETSLTQPIYDCGQALRHVHLCESNGGVFGTGLIPFKAVLQALKDIGYDRFASVKVYRNASMEEAVASSMAYLRRVHEGIGG